MTSEQYAYWCQGLFELTAGTEADPIKVGFTPAQAQVIKDHLTLVFTKATPTRAPCPTILPGTLDMGGTKYCSRLGDTLLC